MDSLYLEFVTERDLYQSFMPFLKDGGLFVRSPEYFELGTEVQLEVLLPDSLEPTKVTGVICWLTPVGAQNGTPPGVGVSFTDDPEGIRAQIEKLLTRQLASSEPTLTM